MHEYPLTKQLVKIVVDAAKSHNAAKVSAVRLVLGESSGIIPDSVGMYFDMIAAGTPAEGAKLEIRTVKAEMHCPRCRKDFPRPRFSFACPDCGTLGSPKSLGDEFYVESVLLETEEEEE
ncbi:MAG: hydrogenase maturation nickel metallochaperone HypA [Bacillota bacterium]|nr:hydrogenase maturation nickel metallochaperone HypA [Bacillota bacterium]